MGEPWAYHILNRYFDEFIPAAIATAEAARAQGTSYSYLIQPLVVSLYFDCANAGLVSWPGSGFAHPGTPLLHCPNASSVNALKAALKRGDVYMHAFPHDGEASYYPDVTLFEAALQVAFDVADNLSIPRPTSVSQRDVPGWTRAALPTLNAHGINGLSFGAGTPPGKPDTPPIFVWRDEASGAEVVTTYETAYGTADTVFVLPNGIAFAACWQGDNRGAPDLNFTADAFETIRKQYPAAEIEASTLDAFFQVANQPEVKRLLPVITAEIGDGWIYGVPSDPLKNAQFRAACRLRRQCISDGRCDPQSAGMKAYDRLLTKIPEHTWGVAQAWFLPDYTNWSNTDFDKARAQQPNGFVSNNTVHADYNTTVNSWIEQRTWVTAGPAVLAHDEPGLAHDLAVELDAISHPQVPSSETGFTEISTSDLTTPIHCDGGIEVQFGLDGSLTQLITKSGEPSWASLTNPLGQYRYQSFTDDDYWHFLADFAIRLPGKGCEYQPGGNNDMSCGNFRKPNINIAHPKHRDMTGNLTSLKQKTGACEFLAEVTFPEEPVTNAGAPRTVVISVNVSAAGAEWDVYTTDKRPTRLPESLFFTFNPVVDASAYRLVTLNHTLDPTDTLGAHGNGSVYGGSPHLRGVEAVTGVAKDSPSRPFTLSSLDVPIVCTGKPIPFPTPRNSAPDMTYGVSYNIFQNIWNTNYILWYPYQPEDGVIRSRFSFSV
eukprot:m.9819 g.9819  ORF g.9819 m.9819 type:complete len:715 (-) comp2679_c0_seq1:122-2266(-)